MEEVHREWGRNIRSGRSVLGLSQKQFGELLGVDQSTIARWERGDMAPRDRHKVKIAETLRQDVRQLFPLMRVAS